MTGAATSPVRTGALDSAKELLAATTKKLKASGLTVKDAVTLRVTPILAKDVPSRLPGLAVARSGFKLPYFDIKGKPTNFYRFRYLEYGDESGFAKVVAPNRRQLRYAQPVGSINELYLPPSLDWKAIAADPERSLIITEGELKAAAGSKMLAEPTIGLGGVWCFRSAAEGLPILPGFSDFDWNGRIVYICYDSDAAANTQVQAAENFLARALLALGAVPMICRIPSLDKDGKTGLDDYLIAKGRESFNEKVLAKACEWDAARELFALNEEVTYVEDPGLILRLDTLQRMSPRAFVDHAYSTRVYNETVISDKSSKLVERSAPKEWLKWGHRSTVSRITYLPGKERSVDGAMNLWPGWGTKPERGEVRLWKELLDYIFRAAAPENRRWFEQWLAYPLQNPGVKLYSAAVLWGINHGTGKSLIGYTMMKIYGRNSTEISDRDLNSTHNEWAEHRQFVMGDEITGGDKRSSSDRMKSIITQRELRINPKYISSYTVPDCINYYFTSNHPDAFFLEDTDRRYFVHEVSGAPLAGEFYKQYANWLGLLTDGNRDRNLANSTSDTAGSGASALFYHLLSLDMSGFNPQGHAPVTASKKDMIDSGRSDVASWVARLREDPDTVLAVAGKALNYSLWTTAELFSLYDPQGNGRVTANGLGRELRRAGFGKVVNGDPIRTSDGLQRLWAIRDTARLMEIKKVAELGKLYDAERGVKPGERKQSKY